MKCRVRPGLGLWQVSRGRERGVKELRAMMATPTKAKLAKEGGEFRGGADDSDDYRSDC